MPRSSSCEGEDKQFEEDVQVHNQDKAGIQEVKMGFIIRNEKDKLIIRPSLLSGLLRHKLIIEKRYLKKGVKLIDIGTNSQFDIEWAV